MRLTNERLEQLAATEGAFAPDGERAMTELLALRRLVQRNFAEDVAREVASEFLLKELLDERDELVSQRQARRAFTGVLARKGAADQMFPPLEPGACRHPRRYSVEFADCRDPSREGDEEWTRKQRDGMKSFALRLLDELEQREQSLLAACSVVSVANMELAVMTGTLEMAASRLGGLVEGEPTARHNLLQRVDELVAQEVELAAMRKSQKEILTKTIALLLVMIDVAKAEGVSAADLAWLKEMHTKLCEAKVSIEAAVV